jgi:hypothetical protein
MYVIEDPVQEVEGSAGDVNRGGKGVMTVRGNYLDALYLKQKFK